MTLEERKLYSALLIFFKQLAFNPQTNTYFINPALTENGGLVEFQNDMPKLTQFFSLKNALNIVHNSVSDMDDFFDSASDEKLALLITFFNQLTECGATYEPMFAPMYIKSSTVDLGASLYDLKPIYISIIQLPNSELVKAVKNNNLIPVNALFNAMQRFSKAMLNVNADLLKANFGNNIDRLQQWQYLPSIHIQELFWKSFTKAFEKKENKFIEEMPSMGIGLSVSFLHKFYVYCTYDEEQRHQMNGNIYFPMLIIPSFVYAIYREYLRHYYYYNQVISHDDKVKITEERIIQMGTFHQQLNADSATHYLSLQSSVKTLLAEANVNDSALNDEEKRAYGFTQ